MHQVTLYCVRQNDSLTSAHLSYSEACSQPGFVEEWQYPGKQVSIINDTLRINTPQGIARLPLPNGFHELSRL